LRALLTALFRGLQRITVLDSIRFLSDGLGNQQYRGEKALQKNFANRHASIPSPSGYRRIVRQIRRDLAVASNPFFTTIRASSPITPMSAAANIPVRYGSSAGAA
jgi:hypothetical protein